MKLENFRKFACLRISECTTWNQVEKSLKKYHNLSVTINTRRK